MERDVSTGKKGVSKKRLRTAAKTHRGRRGQLDSKHSLGSHSPEERAVIDLGLRILARMLARAHLQRRGVLTPEVTDSKDEAVDSPVEGISTPQVDITGTP